MIKWFNEPVPQFESSALTMGNFDGLHLGHQKVLQDLKEQAAALNVPAVVLTYWEHPGHFVHFKHQVPILTPRVLKSALLSQLGAEYTFYLNFSAETAHVSAEEFLRDVIVSYFHPRIIVAGHDSHFGYQREGDAAFLQRCETVFGYQTVQVEPVLYEGTIISSSRIREQLLAGNIKTANAMLGKPYSLFGQVTHGHKMGRSIGFPTINLSLIDREQLIPANGIYFSQVWLEGMRYFGLTNIGTSPTLKKTDQIEIETYILDFTGDTYETEVKLDLLEYMREEKTFAEVEELRSAIANDIRQGRELMKIYGNKSDAK